MNTREIPPGCCVVYLEVLKVGERLPPPFLVEWMEEWAQHSECEAVYLLRSQDQEGLFLLEAFWRASPPPVSLSHVEGWQLRCWNFECVSGIRN